MPRSTSTTTSTSCCATRRVRNRTLRKWGGANTRRSSSASRRRSATPWREYLSVERNKALLNELIDRYGRKEYEMVVRVANAPGKAAPQRWWKS